MGKTWRKQKIDRKEKRRLARLEVIRTQIMLLDAELRETPSGSMWVVVLFDEKYPYYPWQHKTFGPYSNPLRALSALTKYRSDQRANNSK